MLLQLEIIPTKRSYLHTFIETDALLDCCSDTNLLRKEVVQRLNPKRKQKRLSVTNPQSKSCNINSTMCHSV